MRKPSCRTEIPVSFQGLYALAPCVTLCVMGLASDHQNDVLRQLQVRVDVATRPSRLTPIIAMREEDWKEIGFADLSIDSFIKVGDKYLKPDAPNVLVLTPGVKWIQFSIESSGCKFNCAWVFSVFTCIAGLVIGILVHEKFREEPQMRTFAIVSLAVSSIVMALSLIHI